jgi:hypothetical protein
MADHTKDKAIPNIGDGTEVNPSTSEFSSLYPPFTTQMEPPGTFRPAYTGTEDLMIDPIAVDWVSNIAINRASRIKFVLFITSSANNVIF